MKAIKKVIQTKEIRTKLLWVVMIAIAIRVIAQVPIPWVNRELVRTWFDSNNGAFSLFDLLSGGSLSNMSVLALSITPYITASIIIELLSIAFPSLEEMHKDGETGRKKIERITQYTAVGLAFAQASLITYGFAKNGYLETVSVISVIGTVIVLLAGTILLIFAGHLITEHGYGNGISVILLVNILAGLPTSCMNLYEQFIKGKTVARGILAAVIILAVIFAISFLIITLENGTKNIPVTYSGKMASPVMGRTATSNIPLKVNTSGVIPVIFASSIMSMPGIVMALIGHTPTSKIGSFLSSMLSESNWFRTSNWGSTIGVIPYVFLIIFFSYFYTVISFNPDKIANDIRNAGGMVPGIRPGAPTRDYLAKVSKNVILIGAVLLAIVALAPHIACGLSNVSVSFGGTSLMIIASVFAELAVQIKADITSRSYKGFIR